MCNRTSKFKSGTAAIKRVTAYMHVTVCILLQSMRITMTDNRSTMGSV